MQRPRILSDRYVLYDRIGSGGMATVHVGRVRGPAGFARTVAIKQLNPQAADDPSLAAALVDEATIAARLHHPNVVGILDVVTVGTEVFLVLEYAHAESLSTLMRLAEASGAPPSTAVSVAIVLGVLAGLEAAHSARDERGQPLEIVHRDVAPGNVLVGTDGLPRVIDFGIASAKRRTQGTGQGLLKGTLSYLAPEQLAGGSATPATDVYGAGIVLWELLTGRRLFTGENEGWILEQIRLGWVDPPSKYAPLIPDSLDDVVLRALATDPAARFVTAREMAAALKVATLPAPQSEVGEWVASVGGAALVRRQERISEIEALEAVERNQSGAPPATSTLPVAEATKGGRATAAVVALALVGTVSVAAFLARSPGARDETGPGSTSSLPIVERRAAAMTHAPDAAASERAVREPAKVNATASAPSQPASTPQRPGPKAPRPAPPSDCEPPYVVDAEGILRYKRHCLRE